MYIKAIPISATQCDLTRTTMRSCLDPKTPVSNFWSPGGLRRQAAACAVGQQCRLLLLVPPPLAPVQLQLLLYIKMDDNNLIIN